MIKIVLIVRALTRMFPGRNRSSPESYQRLGGSSTTELKWVASLLFGFLPIGLAYHALFSVACGVVWALAVRFAWPAELEAWPGRIHALDFTGHGKSSVPAAGGYTAEVLMADADLAVDHLGPSTVVGRGLGAYVALLLTGARPKRLRGTILRDGLRLDLGVLLSHPHCHFVRRHLDTSGIDRPTSDRQC